MLVHAAPARLKMGRAAERPLPPMGGPDPGISAWACAWSARPRAPSARPSQTPPLRSSAVCFTG